MYLWGYATMSPIKFSWPLELFFDYSYIKRIAHLIHVDLFENQE